MLSVTKGIMRGKNSPGNLEKLKTRLNYQLKMRMLAMILRRSKRVSRVMAMISRSSTKEMKSNLLSSGKTRISLMTLFNSDSKRWTSHQMQI
jgi:hypothetical protein